MINENFAYLGVLITLIGGLGYAFDTYRGKIKPNKISWFLWALAPLIAFAAQLSQGVGLQSLLAFAVGFVPAIVFIVSFLNKQSYWKIDNFDILCGALSLLGLILWMFTKVGNIAIIFSIFSDLTASIPTAVKAFREPASESANVYVANTASAVITLLTVKKWNFATFGFSAYIFLVMGLIAFLIVIKPKLNLFLKRHI